MTKNRKVYVGVLAVALLVLMWDKFFTSESVSSPQVSQAASVGPPAAARPVAQPGVGPAADRPTAAPRPPASVSRQGGGVLSVLLGTGARKPSTIGGNGSYRDLFSTPPAQSISKPTPEETDLILQQRMAKHLKLTGTLVLRGSSTASINGKTYSQGDYIGPYQVEEVGESYVVLVSDNYRATLFIDP